MATNTYIALKTEVLTSAVPSVTFNLSGITGYTDLVIVSSQQSSNGGSTLNYRFNGDTSSNYSTTMIVGNGSTANSYRTINATYGEIGYHNGANTRVVNMLQVFNYENTTTFKTSIARDSDPNSTINAYASLWRKTPEAITSVTLILSAGNFAIGDTFTLYGITAASVGAKATGGTIYQDASYFYHVFAGNGTFTPALSLSADVLVVAGGGGGGNTYAGGGGAGGLLAHTGQSLTATGYSVTVGSGGASNTVGGNSQFASLTASVGGGRGATYGSNAGGNGGSGGGGAGSNGNSNKGLATSGQGYDGSDGGLSGNYGAGAGGGAGAVGGTPGTNSGIGGIGSSAYTSWSNITGIGELSSGTYYLAGGGGGGKSNNGANAAAGGLGGGAAGSNSGNGSNGLSNTGGGGGGAYSASGGIGGSGVVIVRYAK